MKLKNTEKGITLIAIVVTIVLLLILGGASIHFVLKQNGIIGRADEAENTLQLNEEKERLTMYIMQALNERGKFDSEEFNKIIESVEGWTYDKELSIVQTNLGQRFFVDGKGYKDLYRLTITASPTDANILFNFNVNGKYIAKSRNRYTYIRNDKGYASGCNRNKR